MSSYDALRVLLCKVDQTENPSAHPIAYTSIKIATIAPLDTPSRSNSGPNYADAPKSASSTADADGASFLKAIWQQAGGAIVTSSSSSS